jgi:hypothetical protein
LNGDDIDSVIDIHAPLLMDGTVRRVGNGIAQTRHSNEPTPTLYSVRVTGVPIAQKFVADLGLRPPKPERCDPVVWRLLSQCWALEPEDRPSFKEVLRVMDSIDERALENKRMFPCHVPSAIPLEDPMSVECESLASQGRIAGVKQRNHEAAE